MCIYDDGNSVFPAKKTNAKFGGVGANGDRGKNLSSKVPYLKSPTLICLFAVPFSWGYDDD